MKSFDEMADLLFALGSAVNPAAYHGQLCGQIAGGKRLSLTDLSAQTADVLVLEEDVVESSQDEWQQFYQDTLNQLLAEDFEFVLLLPGDDATMEERLTSLASWCESFLSGLGESGLDKGNTLTDEVAEALQDIAALALVEVEQQDEEDEQVQFSEIEEYLRVAVQLIYAELGYVEETENEATYH